MSEEQNRQHMTPGVHRHGGGRHAAVYVEGCEPRSLSAPKRRQVSGLSADTFQEAGLRDTGAARVLWMLWKGK